MRVTPSNSPPAAAASAAAPAAAAHAAADTTAQARRSLRVALRAKRRAVTPEFRAKAARQVARNVDRVFRLRPGLRVALYASFREELDSAPLIQLARRRGCRIFLPRIDARTTTMKFVEARARARNHQSTGNRRASRHAAHQGALARSRAVAAGGFRCAGHAPWHGWRLLRPHLRVQESPRLLAWATTRRGRLFVPASSIDRKRPA